MDNKINIQILLFQENNIWVAQCLEYDFAIQGSTKQEALNSLERVVLGQIILDVKSNKEPLQDIDKSPDYYFQAFEDALRLEQQWMFKPLSLENSLQQILEVSVIDIRLSNQMG